MKKFDETRADESIEKRVTTTRSTQSVLSALLDDTLEMKNCEDKVRRIALSLKLQASILDLAVREKQPVSEDEPDPVALWQAEEISLEEAIRKLLE